MVWTTIPVVSTVDERLLGVIEFQQPSGKLRTRPLDGAWQPDAAAVARSRSDRIPSLSDCIQTRGFRPAWRKPSRPTPLVCLVWGLDCTCTIKCRIRTDLTFSCFTARRFIFVIQTDISARMFHFQPTAWEGKIAAKPNHKIGCVASTSCYFAALFKFQLRQYTRPAYSARASFVGTW